MVYGEVSDGGRHAGLDWIFSFFLDPQIPKHVINETQCAPCPECVKTRYHSQCKRTKITDDGLSVHFHEAILQNLPKREQSTSFSGLKGICLIFFSFSHRVLLEPDWQSSATWQLQ